MSLTAEQLEAARAERMRHNGHGATTLEDVRTWIEETGLCMFLPRSAQAGIQSGAHSSTANPTFVEAVAGQRTNEPSAELIATSESLLVRLEAEGVAVRLNLSGQPHNHSGDQPDYVVAGWVLPYIYALRGDRDWRRSPQLTGSRQVSQLAVLAAKQIDGANQSAAQIRDALGREVTEVAVLRALHELWKQLRIIPVVPEVGSPALWQPLRQRFQKAIAEGASTSQVTAISVLASIYLQAVIAGSMEDVELFLSPLTARSKIREVVRGLAATRQVHSTTLGQSPMYYVAGTLPEFPAVPSFQISTSYSSYRSANYRGSASRGSSYASYLGQVEEEDFAEAAAPVFKSPAAENVVEQLAASVYIAPEPEAVKATPAPIQPIAHKAPARPAAVSSSAKPAQPRPRTVGPVHPRERSRTASSGSDSRRSPAPRSNGSAGSSARPANANGNGAKSRTAARPAAHPASRPSRAGAFSNGNGNHPANGNGSHTTAKSNGNGVKSGPAKSNGTYAKAANGNGSVRSGARPATSSAPAKGTRNAAPARATSRTGDAGRKPAAASAAKRYSFSGQAKQAPKPAAKAGVKAGVKAGAKPASRATSSKRRG